MKRRSSRGFSLLEVLVAFAILALLGGVLFQIFGSALHNASVGEDYSRALLIAETHLATLGVDSALREGSDSGTEGDGRFNWTVTVSPYVAPAAAPASPTPGMDPASVTLSTKLVQVDSSVAWGETEAKRSVTLTTLRLMPTEKPQ
jgi:general secretion pathway protein I